MFSCYPFMAEVKHLSHTPYMQCEVTLCGTENGLRTMLTLTFIGTSCEVVSPLLDILVVYFFKKHNDCQCFNVSLGACLLKYY